MDNEDLGTCAVSNESHAFLHIQYPVWIRCKFCKAKMPTEPVDLVDLTNSPSPTRPYPVILSSAKSNAIICEGISLPSMPRVWDRWFERVLEHLALQKRFLLAPTLE